MNQLSLFPPAGAEPTRRPPDLANIRKSLNRLLRLAREAEIMPWSDGEAESWQKLFPELAALLPNEECNSLVSEFRQELMRLRSTS